LTRKQILTYLDQLTLQIENNKREVYELTRVLKDYMAMQGEFENFAEYREKLLGLSAEIPTRQSVFFKSIKDKYLQIKKILDFKK
jgi:hypothetical protein